MPTSGVRLACRYVLSNVVGPARCALDLQDITFILKMEKRMTQFTKRVASGVVLLLCVTVLTTPATAQATASIEATATVAGGFDPLTATGVQNLDFGTVTAGLGPVDAVEAGFGRFNLTGEPSAAVLVEYTTLPTQLDDGFGNNIPISFDATDGILWGGGFPGAFTTFNPLITQTLAFGGVGNLTVGIAGTVDPPLVAVDGDYTGTIVLTVAYP